MGRHLLFVFDEKGYEFITLVKTATGLEGLARMSPSSPNERAATTYELLLWRMYKINPSTTIRPFIILITKKNKKQKTITQEHIKS